MDGWVDRELGVELPDRRLRARLGRILGDLGRRVGGTLPAACQVWAATKAAYRFFSNSRVDEGVILAGHFAATRSRFAATTGPILVLHDTTEFSFKRDSPVRLWKVDQAADCVLPFEIPTHVASVIIQSVAPSVWFGDASPSHRHQRPTETDPLQRLKSIDMLRGVAALGVVAYHVNESYPAPAPLGPIVSQGWAGVILFFVISGFCIHYREAGGGSGPVDFQAFWIRRARRLYPAYLGALLLWVALGWWSGRAFEGGYDIAMHLLMLHNLDTKTTFSLNPVFWTLAIEEQLYLLYFALLAVRRRWGWPAALVQSQATCCERRSSCSQP